MLLDSTKSQAPDADGAMDRLVDLLYASAHDDALWTEVLDATRSFLALTRSTLRVDRHDSADDSRSVRCEELAELAQACGDPGANGGSSPAAACATALDRWDLSLGSRTLPSEQLQLLADHLRRALELHARLRQPPDFRRQLDIWSSSDVCLVVVQDGNITHTNASATRALDSGRAISREGATLRFVDAPIEERFQAFSRSLHDSSRGAPLRLKLLSGLRDGDRALVEISAVRDFKKHDQEGQHDCGESILIVVTFVDDAGAGRARAIDALTALTPTEREILTALAGGETVESLAARQDRSAHTLRWHVKNIIAKTGSASLTDAVRLASLMVPL
jgi:DNA-binding CsgD family transcriptional regulator